MVTVIALQYVDSGHYSIQVYLHLYPSYLAQLIAPKVQDGDVDEEEDYPFVEVADRSQVEIAALLQQSRSYKTPIYAFH